MKNRYAETMLSAAVLLVLTGCGEDILKPTEGKSGSQQMQRYRQSRTGELTRAMAAYERAEESQRWLQPRDGSGPRRTLVNDAYMPRFKGDPSWKYYAVSGNDTLDVVDVDMTECVVQDFVPEENERRYMMTGDRRYRRSYTRYVYIRDKRDGREQTYYMTLIPSVKYAERYNGRIHRNLYLKRDKNLDGIVLFHTLSGIFVNGWIYRDGKITGEILPHGIMRRDKVKGSLKMKRAKAKYEVRVKVRFGRRLSKTDEEDGIMGPTLPEIEVTGEGGSGEGGEWWEEDGGEQPDAGEGDTPEWGDEDRDEQKTGGGGAGVTGSNATASLSKVMAELKKLLNVDVKNVDEKYRDCLIELVNTVKMMQSTAIGKVLCDFLKNNTSMKVAIAGAETQYSWFSTSEETIYYRESSTKDFLVVAEEMAHAYQYYGCYGVLMSESVLNFEFEAKVISEFMFSMYRDIEVGLLYSFLRDKCGGEFDILIEGLKEKSLNDALYHICLGRWVESLKNEEKGNGYEGEYDETLSPEALWRLINNGVDPNK